MAILKGENHFQFCCTLDSPPSFMQGNKTGSDAYLIEPHNLTKQGNQLAATHETEEQPTHPASARECWRAGLAARPKSVVVVVGGGEGRTGQQKARVPSSPSTAPRWPLQLPTTTAATNRQTDWTAFRSAEPRRRRERPKRPSPNREEGRR